MNLAPYLKKMPLSLARGILISLALIGMPLDWNVKLILLCITTLLFTPSVLYTGIFAAVMYLCFIITSLV
jgi:hypothetical protein